MLTRMKQSMKEKTGSGHATAYSPEYLESCKVADDMHKETNEFLDKLKPHVASFGAGNHNKVEVLSHVLTNYATNTSKAGPKLSTGLTAVSRALTATAAEEKDFQAKVEAEVAAPLRSWDKEYYANFVKQRDVLKKKRQEMDGLSEKHSKKPTDEAVKEKLDAAIAAHNEQMEVVKEILSHLPEEMEKHRKIYATFVALSLHYHQTAQNAFTTAHKDIA